VLNFSERVLKMKKYFLFAISAILSLSILICGCGNLESANSSSFNQLEGSSVIDVSSNKANIETYESSTNDTTSSKNQPTAKTINLTKDAIAKSVNGKEADDNFKISMANFSVNLFKETIANEKNKNALISPLSAELVLAMVFNGADGNTKKEFKNLMGGIPIETLNEYLYSYINGLNKNEIKFNLANSIWLKNGISVKEDFLNVNKSYYNSEIFTTEFDSNSINDINKWASDNTDNMIEKFLKENDLDKSTLMCLINTLIFDANWNNSYSHSDATQEFTNINGEIKTVQTLKSLVSCHYTDDKATGFKKDYVGYNFSFVALLPNKDININDYINSLTGEKLLKTINNPEEVYFTAQMPEFTYECDYNMVESLSNLGISSAFSSKKADFSKISSHLYIDKFIQKTKISVNEVGTKAAAATAAMMTKSSSPKRENDVIIDRPFVYMIIDNKTNLPIFMGAVMDV
jgi:serpin B